jgi:hypothetical protein
MPESTQFPKRRREAVAAWIEALENQYREMCRIAKGGHTDPAKAAQILAQLEAARTQCLEKQEGLAADRPMIEKRSANRKQLGALRGGGKTLPSK